ncbi:hypothetical protein FD20_GL002501 [Liquorilactobacillus uvarum DSM 19971]|uniref:Uncharacterized protein n=1 Tax=Liquorilactobacillus uvarum DSM 19971 TaxID=1423812 RepID=A0A0R1PKH3_9LACO|nr:TIGR04141 family sporadically distributed protein [Liquorilactobacillus uvarum]KRL32657.1 hypothetical protein FD20_GL002501 [Liquorilactobacillus uvarum DSM 19971]
MNEQEGDYNKKISDFSKSFVLLDKKDYQPQEYGYSKVEPCDILTNKNQFIHVKKGESSSKLSHLFLQGLVSAKILAQDRQNFIEHINSKITEQNKKFFLSAKDKNEKFEIIFGIINKRKINNQDLLPFFSMITLIQVVDELNVMGFNYSLMMINRETD